MGNFFDIGEYVELICFIVLLQVSSLVSMTGDCQRHFRIKVKELFAILTRRFGFVIYLT